MEYFLCRRLQDCSRNSHRFLIAKVIHAAIVKSYSKRMVEMLIGMKSFLVMFTKYLKKSAKALIDLTTDPGTTTAQPHVSNSQITQYKL